jgi:hypothetical protein
MRQLFVFLALSLIVLPASADDTKGFKPLFDGKTLTGWKVYPDGTGKWKVEDGAIVSAGPASHLFTENGDYTNFHLRAEVSINEGGNSGMYFRTRFGPGFPKGYEAQINATHSDPIRTGSLYPTFNPRLTASQKDKISIKEKLHKPDEWFTYEVIAKGNHIVIKVNGKTTVDFVDDAKTYMKGHFAFQQHHVGNLVKIRKVEVKELSEEK